MPTEVAIACTNWLSVPIPMPRTAIAAAMPAISRLPTAGVPHLGLTRVQTRPRVPSRPIASAPRAVGSTPVCSEATEEKSMASSGSAASGCCASWVPR